MRWNLDKVAATQHGADRVIHTLEETRHPFLVRHVTVTVFPEYAVERPASS